jgi:hypothetical protein
MILKVRITGVSGVSGQSVRVTLDHHGVKMLLEGTHLLVAAGQTRSEHEIHWVGVGRSGIDGERISQSERMPGDECARRVGSRRSRAVRNSRT